MILISSDWHLGPDGLTPQVKELLKIARQPEISQIILLGDILEFMEYHWSSFKNSTTVNELNVWLNDKKTVYIEGNHDPIKFMNNLNLDKIPNLTLVPKWYCVLVNGKAYHLSHGHKFSDWRWWSRLSDLLITLVPILWKPFQQVRKVIMPLPAKGGLGKDIVPYSQYIGIIHTNAIMFAEQNNCTVITGHNHKPFISGPLEDNPIFCDVGDMVGHNSYLTIDDNGKMDMHQL